MPDLKIEQILDRVRNMEYAMSPRFEVADEDWKLYNLDPFIPRAGEGIRREDAVTSNRPKVFANQLVGGIAGAKQIIRVEMDADKEEERDANNNYERFAIGALRLADKRLVNAGGAPLRTELGFRAITCGIYVAARALLRKDESGETIVDVKPIHPRQLLIQFGADGPIWAGVVTMRSRATIRGEYPKFTFEGEDDKEEDATRTERVVDYYWKERGKFMNAVIVDRQWAKKPTNTFAERFPIVARAVGAHSGTSGMLSLSENANGTTEIPGIETFGESAFAPIRANNRIKNRLTSYQMSMAGKRVRGVMKVFSSDGLKELDAELDEDTESLSMSKDNQEDVEPLVYQDLGRDLESLLGNTNREEADGTLPDQSLGRVDVALSGTALNLLGAAEGQRLEPFIRPVESCIEGVIEALGAQFETGRYKPIKVMGKTRTRERFNREIKPEDIKGHDDITVELEPILPVDRNQTWLTAQVATTPGADGVALVSALTAREEILKLQDADLENERIFAQMARTSTPKMLLMTQLIAADRRGDEGTVQFLTKELQRLITDEDMQDFAKKLAFMQLVQQSGAMAAAGTGGPGGGAPQNGGGGIGGQGGLNAEGTPPNPLRGIQPEFIGTAGAQGATGPLTTEQRANAIGITLAQR